MRLILLVTLALVAVGCGLPQRPQVHQGGGAGAPAAVPTGTVIAFFGNEIPAGWTVCDGRSTATGRPTPDLRGRFVLGAVPGPEVGQSGGSEAHSHDAGTGEASGGSYGVDRDNNAFLPTSGHRHAVEVSPAGHLPPFTRLVYLMKD